EDARGTRQLGAGHGSEPAAAAAQIAGATAGESIRQVGVTSFPRSAWERTLRRSASRRASRQDAERPGVRSHAERGNEEPPPREWIRATMMERPDEIHTNSLLVPSPAGRISLCRGDRAPDGLAVPGG